MRLDNLEKILKTEPKYRLRQAREAVFKNLICNWDKASFLPLALREKLNQECPLEIKAEALISKTKDTIKARIELRDGLKIEAVLMRHRDGRNTVCVSSQAGCPLGCVFCATGSMGFFRNLTCAEIVEQVVYFARYLKKGGKRVTNVTFMGMGEPFLNYDNVLKSAKFFNSKEFFHIGARNISISTAGIAQGIERLSKEGLQFNLAVSLHAPTDELRSELMPINKKINLEKIFQAVGDYIRKTKRQVMFEYLLIKDVNDSDYCARELAKLMKNSLYYLNLILYNPTGLPRPQAGKFEPSGTERVKKFKQILKNKKVVFSQRWKFGKDIKAACGQFVT